MGSHTVHRVRKGQTAEATEHAHMPAPCLAQN